MDRCLILIPLNTIFIILYFNYFWKHKPERVKQTWNGKRWPSWHFSFQTLYLDYSVGQIIITKFCFCREVNLCFCIASSLLIPSSLFFISETIFFISRNSIWVIFISSICLFKMLMLSFNLFEPMKISYNNCLNVFVYWLYHFSVCFH